ncbi:hypothetical protein FQA39_LY01505 [Lamprigera yunnana]|nr:hypothetical protein FQA39_LY01505 [Lamprigera yunnana]
MTHLSWYNRNKKLIIVEVTILYDNLDDNWREHVICGDFYDQVNVSDIELESEVVRRTHFNPIFYRYSKLFEKAYVRSKARNDEFEPATVTDIPLNISNVQETISLLSELEPQPSCSGTKILGGITPPPTLSGTIISPLANLLLLKVTEQPNAKTAKSANGKTLILTDTPEKKPILEKINKGVKKRKLKLREK